MGWSEIGEEKQVVLSEPLAELVGGGRNAKYVRDCFELHLGRKGASTFAASAAGPVRLSCWDERSSILVHVTTSFLSKQVPSQQPICDACAI
jgi:hypothetical protein